MFEPITARPVTPICAVPVVPVLVMQQPFVVLLSQNAFLPPALSRHQPQPPNNRRSSVNQGTATATVGTTSTATAARYAVTASRTLLGFPPSRRTRITVVGPPAAIAPEGVGPAAHATRARASGVGPAVRTAA